MHNLLKHFNITISTRDQSLFEFLIHCYTQYLKMLDLSFHPIFSNDYDMSKNGGMVRAVDEALVHNATRGRLGFLIESRGSSENVHIGV